MPSGYLAFGSLRENFVSLRSSHSLIPKLDPARTVSFGVVLGSFVDNSILLVMITKSRPTMEELPRGGFGDAVDQNVPTL